MTDDELREIEERAAKATPGPWGADQIYVALRYAKKHDIWCDAGYDDSKRMPEEDDAEFIADARADVPALCAEVRRLRAEQRDVAECIAHVVVEIAELRRLEKLLEAQPGESIAAAATRVTRENSELRDAIDAALAWRGLDGDGISQPVLDQLRAARGMPMIGDTAEWQECSECGGKTGRRHGDVYSLKIGDIGPLCNDCYDGIHGCAYQWLDANTDHAILLDQVAARLGLPNNEISCDLATVAELMRRDKAAGWHDD